MQWKEAFKFILESKDLQKMFKDIEKGQKQVEAVLKQTEQLKKKKWK